jgi:hypothetical protein
MVVPGGLNSKIIIKSYKILQGKKSFDEERRIYGIVAKAGRAQAITQLCGKFVQEKNHAMI